MAFDRGKEFAVVGPDLGYITGAPAEVVPDRGWTAVANARFYMGNAEKIPGWVRVQANGLDSQVMGLFQYSKSDGLTNFWIAVTQAKIYKKGPNDATFVDITGVALTGGVSDWVDFAVFKDTLLITNGQDPIQSWDGVAATVSALAGSPPKARRITVFQNHVVLTDINPNSGSPSHQTIQWSDLGTATVWTGGESGTLSFFDEPSILLTSVPLRDSLICYKGDAAYVVDYTGAPFTMTSRRLMIGSGPISARAVINVRDLHYYLGNDREAYRLSFFGPEPVGQAIREGLFGELNWQNVNNSHAALNQTGSEIYFWIPVGNDLYPSVAYVMRYREDKWGRAVFPTSVTCAAQAGAKLLNATRWQDATTAWNVQTATWFGTVFAKGSQLILHADATTFLVQQHTSGQVDADGVALALDITSKAFAFEDPGKFKKVQRLYINYVAASGTTLNIDVLTAKGPGIAYTTAQTLSIVLDGSGNQWVPLDASGVYFKFRFYTSGLNQQVKLTGYVPVAYIRSVT